LGFRWKRFRRTNKKPPDHDRKFRLAQEEIEELRSISDLTVAYFDEAAFSLQGVVPYGWQLIGERSDVWLGTEHGNVQVLGIEEEDGTTYGYLHKGRVYGKTVAEVLEDYSQRITGRTVVVLDNASVHTCGLVQDQMERWNERGLFFYFLPSQSPELNDIEHLWKRLKYQDLPLDAWECLKSLVSRLKETFHGIGDAILLPSLQD
jgi:transposase